MATLNKNLMKFRLIFQTFILSCFLIACTSPTQSSEIVSTQTSEAISTPQPLTGIWMGTAQAPDDKVNSLIVNFDESTLQVEPYTKTWKFFVSQTDSTFQFSVGGKANDPFKQIEFTGTLINGVFTGELSWDGTTSAITFTPIAIVDKTVLDKYEGVYRFESGRALSIIVSPEYSSGGLYFFSKTLMLTDFDSGALRSLYPTSDAKFLVGVLRDVGAPFDGRVEFMRDAQGKVSGLSWWENLQGDMQFEFAKRVDYTIEEHVEFTSQDGTKLVGRLSLPNSDVPVPAFMALHGSEQGTRDNFGSKVMAHYMISRGFAVLNYDKRGVGDSEGVYQEAANATNLQRHASDAIAGVGYLASRPEVDATRIGLIGGSQAGWVIPLAASQSLAITHIVILSGPVESTVQEDVFSSYTNDGDTASKYDDAKITQQLREMSPGGFDPIPIIAELKQPGLWLWGSVDKSVPVTFSAENLQVLIDSGKNNFSYEIFPNGDHNLNESLHGWFAEIPYSPRVLFYSTLAEWLEANMSKEQ